MRIDGLILYYLLERRLLPSGLRWRMLGKWPWVRCQSQVSKHTCKRHTATDIGRSRNTSLHLNIYAQRAVFVIGVVTCRNSLFWTTNHPVRSCHIRSG